MVCRFRISRLWMRVSGSSLSRRPHIVAGSLVVLATLAMVCVMRLLLIVGSWWMLLAVFTVITVRM